MTTFKQDYLYIMQAKDGRVKIGRSVDPEKRRRQFEMQGGMRISLVAALEKRGDDEYELLGELWEHITIGEWVKNRLATWGIINTFLGTDIKPIVQPPIVRPRGPRKVRMKLADGTVKEYFYPAQSSPKAGNDGKRQETG